MPLDDDAAYLALQARDARFDGRLFVGVTSTGIYCRPVCRVRTPQRGHCRFFASAAQAQGAGFRACLKCRPEIAPGLAHTDSSRTLAQQAEALLQPALHPSQDGAAVAAVAARLGVSDRHLRRIFQAEHGVAPQTWRTVQRLLLAKQLLTDTDRPISEVAEAAGFGSSRRLQAAFAAHCHHSPSRLREGRRRGAGAPWLRLAWRPPYAVGPMLAFLARRAVPGLEVVAPGRLQWQRTLALPHQGRVCAGWVDCRFLPERHELRLQASAGLAPVLGAVLQRLRQALDLDAEPARIAPVLAQVPGPEVPGLRLPGSVDGFEAAVRIILGQQVTMAAARTLTARLVQALGPPLEDADAPPGLSRLFPDAAALAAAPDETLGRLGIVRQRVRALKALAQAVAEGELQLHPAAPLQATLERLAALPGLGPWSVQLIALRALGWPDAWPSADLGLLQALGHRDAKRAELQAMAWRPWRGYALMKLWLAAEGSPAPPLTTAADTATP